MSQTPLSSNSLMGSGNNSNNNSEDNDHTHDTTHTNYVTTADVEAAILSHFDTSKLNDKEDLKTLIRTVIDAHINKTAIDLHLNDNTVHYTVSELVATSAFLTAVNNKIMETLPTEVTKQLVKKLMN